ncbi:hypothetical protein HY485_03405 [Candidatus Woesearchaeota archaeon]|nr:hypothetical protein [Candidatus Woesearchaeota archaeon]
MKNNHLYTSIATLVGITIGAGVLGVPYAVAKAGFLTGLLDLVLIGIAMLFLNLILGEVTLRTKGHHQLTGYAQTYLGSWGKQLMSTAMIFGIYGAIVAYIIGGGQSLAQIFGGPAWVWSTLFFITGAIIINKGLKTLEESEFAMEATKLIIFTIIVALIFFTRTIHTENLAVFNVNNLLLPYGIILFAFLGTTAIPEMREELQKNKHALKKAIIIGSIIPLIVYTIFALTVVGTAGTTTTEIATITIGQQLGNIGLALANLFAVLALMTSYIGLGYGLSDMYHHDYKLKEKTAWILTCSIPVLILIIGVQSFAKTIEITGALSGGLTCILIVLMHWKAQKHSQRKPEYTIKLNWLLRSILITLFTTGAFFAVKGFF